MGKKVTRLYTGSDGESHFEDIEVPLLEIKGVIGRRSSELMKATGIFFIEQDYTHERDWHTAPRRQFLIRLEGRSEIEVGDGTKRKVGPGDIVLAEDTTGRGHRGRVLSSPRKTVIVTLD